MHLFLEYYGIPNGLVWGNIAAEPILAMLPLIVLWVFRHTLMQRFVAFHHKHKIIHAKKLEEENGGVPSGPNTP